MNTIVRTLLLLVSLSLVAPSFGCAGRQPTHAKAEKVLHKYFTKYGKKYPTTVYGQYPVSEVSVLEVMELHRHYVHVLADVKLANGGQERIRAALEKKAPVGWRFVAWEQDSPSAALSEEGPLPE